MILRIRGIVPLVNPRTAITRANLRGLDRRRQRAMTDLASSCCPKEGVGDYVGSRLSRYDYGIFSERDGVLQAFMMLQEFVERGERHVYLGPLFSCEGACVPMFTAFFEGLARSPSSGFHLLAEVQNPRIALVFKRLFLRSSFPKLDSVSVPSRALVVVDRFCARLSHIGPVDLPALRGRGTDTLFCPSPAYDPVRQWMRRRGVDLEAGDAQLFVVTCDGSRADRTRVGLDLSSGVRALGAWPSCKRTMLQRFERGAR